MSDSKIFIPVNMRQVSYCPGAVGVLALAGMATHCQIGIMYDPSNIRSIYCRFDGYPSRGVGDDLLSYYNRLDLAEALIALGSLRSLYSSLEETRKESYSVVENAPLQIAISTSVEDYIKACRKVFRASYAYLFNVAENRWEINSYYLQPMGFVPLVFGV